MLLLKPDETHRAPRGDPSQRDAEPAGAPFLSDLCDGDTEDSLISRPWKEMRVERRKLPRVGGEPSCGSVWDSERDRGVGEEREEGKRAGGGETLAEVRRAGWQRN